MIEAHPIGETPFMAVRWDEDWFVTLGKYRISDRFNSLDECKNDGMNNVTWERLLTVMNVVAKEVVEMQKQKN